MRRDYVPLGVERAYFVFAAHLPGITAALDGFTIGDIRISKLTWGECRLLEKSRFMDDLQDVFFSGREPLFIVFAGYPGDNEEEAARIKFDGVSAIARLTSALRLLKQGEVYDPLEFILYSRHGVSNTRDPRLFGRLAFSLRGEAFMTLSIEDIGLLDGIYGALDLFDHFRFDLSIDRAQTLLGASFSPAHVSYAHKMLPLLAALEILAGRDLGALANAEWADDGVLAWLDRFRWLRNTLAHGRHEDPEALREVVDTTRTVTRVLLREAIVWRLLDPERSEVIGASLIERALSESAASPARLANLQAPYPSLGLDRR